VLLFEDNFLSMIEHLAVVDQNQIVVWTTNRRFFGLLQNAPQLSNESGIPSNPNQITHLKVEAGGIRT
jgi:hypothetical protein